MQEMASCLLEAGAICLPISDFSLATAMRELDFAISAFPEFNRKYVRDGAAEADGRAAMTNKRPLAMDGALATASSFHDSFVRRLRWILYVQARVLFQQLVILDAFKLKFCAVPAHLKLEELIDQLVIRPIGEVPVSEKWHRRAHPPLALSGDIFFDGWFNFGKSPQQFSYQAHSHVSGPANGDGDGRIVTATTITINPGELLICFANIVREVVPVPCPEVTVLLLTGWRLTYGDEPLLGREAFDEIASTGAVVPSAFTNTLPSMYSELTEEVEAFSADAIRQEILEEYRGERRKFISAVPRHMPSLAVLNETLPVYSKQEIALYSPMPLF